MGFSSTFNYSATRFRPMKYDSSRFFDALQDGKKTLAKLIERRIHLAGFVLLLSSIVAPAAVFAVSTTSVSIQSGAPILGSNAFSPNPVTVSAGDSVMWTNNDSTLHLLTNDAGAADTFTTPLLSPLGTFTATFANPGTVPYHCEIHPQMTGTITVNSMFVLPESPFGIAALMGSSLAALGGFLFFKQRSANSTK